MSPDTLVAHAERLLAGVPDEADTRRAISALYYAVYHLVTCEAALILAPSGVQPLFTTIRRSFDHRGLRRLCEGVLSVGRARPKMLVGILPEEIPPELGRIALSVVELQTARLEADYDLETTPQLTAALTCLALAKQVIADWTTIRPDPAAHAFLVALHLADRLARRG